MKISVPPIFKSMELLFAWTNRIILARYQQSFLGWLWAFIQPAASVAIISIIFTKFVHIDTGSIPYPVFSYIAVAPWTFFSSSLADMTYSLVQHMALVSKVYFPREILPIAAMLSRLLDFAVTVGLLIIMLIIYQAPIYLPGLLFFPVILLIQIVLTLGIGLATSAVNVFYRDVSPALSLVVQLWFYASPIIYPVSMVPENLRAIYYLNPMAGVLESYREIFLNQSIPGPHLWIAAGESVLVLIFGYWLFKRLEFLLADIG